MRRAAIPIDDRLATHPIIVATGSSGHIYYYWRTELRGPFSIETEMRAGYAGKFGTPPRGSG